MSNKPGCPIVVEFCGPSRFVIHDIKKDQVPHVINGQVFFRRYRTTIEIIDEPREVLAERLQELFDDTDNMHHIGPLREAARSIGVELQPRIRKNRKGAKS